MIDDLKRSKVPSAAVPDDPVDFYFEYLKVHTLDETIRALYTRAETQGRKAGMKRATRIIERRSEDRVHSTASYDPETNAWEYPKHAEDVGNSLDEEADDCVKAILSAAADLEREP